jgi:hypothetical protein
MARELEALAARLTAGAADERERAVRLHDFVRDRIPFGFAPRLHAATAEETLVEGVAHPIAKTTLFVALLRAAGLRAFSHAVTIDRELLRGVLPHRAYRLLPWELPHAYTEAEVGGRWLRLDSYAVDRPLWRVAVAQLAREDAVLGYGVHRGGTCRWTGADDAFAQLVTPDMIVEDHGPCGDGLAGTPAAGVSASGWSGLFGFAGESAAAACAAQRINEHLAALRRRAAPRLAATH